MSSVIVKTVSAKKCKDGYCIHLVSDIGGGDTVTWDSTPYPTKYLAERQITEYFASGQYHGGGTNVYRLAAVMLHRVAADNGEPAEQSAFDNDSVWWLKHSTRGVELDHHYAAEAIAMAKAIMAEKEPHCIYFPEADIFYYRGKDWPEQAHKSILRAKFMKRAKAELLVREWIMRGYDGQSWGRQTEIVTAWQYHAIWKK